MPDDIFRIFLCGDVMTGRGVDQIFHHPCSPHLYETYVKDARKYLYLAEAKNGKISYPVFRDYIWGEALSIWDKQKPDLRIINLETAITQSDHYWPGKEIHYRMHPLNIDVLTSAHIDICTLANNHILDWGYDGLRETLTTLKTADIQFSGAGKNLNQAKQPAIIQLEGKKRILVFSIGMPTSGVLSDWQATYFRSGVYYLQEFGPKSLSLVSDNIKKHKNPGDLVILSIHWGANWGYDVSDDFQNFAHALIDEAKVDVIFGHSSHHPRPIEIYKNKPILYGCGDFINDYEGISGYESFRGDLVLMYFLDFNRKTLEFEKMNLIPLKIRSFSLHQTTEEERAWLLSRLK